MLRHSAGYALAGRGVDGPSLDRQHRDLHGVADKRVRGRSNRHPGDRPSEAAWSACSMCLCRMPDVWTAGPLSRCAPRCRVRPRP
jgi:hypothetical protein